MDPNLHLADWLGRRVTVQIDRPLGIIHPREDDMVYPINYGFVPGTLAPDGHPIDVYVLDAEEPLDRCGATVIAIVRRRNDVEDKLVAVLDDTGAWDGPAILAAVDFQERYFDSWVELA
ncbi:MAG: inorganic diphosphatase [Chloroflexota bacterium]|nr:inorganic diphosphatase [Chloroflexota bacterium]